MRQMNFALLGGMLLLGMACKGPPVEQQMKKIEENFRQQVELYFQQKTNEATEARDLQKPYYDTYVYREASLPEDAYSNLAYAADEEAVLDQMRKNPETFQSKGEKIANFALMEATEPSKPFKARVRYERNQWLLDETVEPWLIPSRVPKIGPEEPAQEQTAEGEQKKEKKKPEPHYRPLYRKNSSMIVEQDFIFYKGLLSPEGVVKETPKEAWKKELGPWKTE